MADAHEMLDQNINLVKAFLEYNFETVQELIKTVELETYVALASLTASILASFSGQPVEQLEDIRTQLHAAVN